MTGAKARRKAVATGTGSDSTPAPSGGETVRVPRTRIEDEDGTVTEWRSKALPRSDRLTKTAGALSAAVHLVGTSTRRLERALFALFEGAVGKEVVSRAWRTVKVDRQARSARRPADEDIARFARSPGGIAFAGSLPDGTVIESRLGCKATTISALAAIGVRRPSRQIASQSPVGR